MSTTGSDHVLGQLSLLRVPRLVIHHPTVESGYQQLGKKIPNFWGAAKAEWILLPQVRVLSTPSMLLSFLGKFLLHLSSEKNKNKQKGARFGPF